MKEKIEFEQYHWWVKTLIWAGSISLIWNVFIFTAAIMLIAMGFE